MRRRLTLALLLTGLSLSLAAGQPARPDDVEATIRKFERELARHWNAKEPDKFVAYYAPDATLLLPNHEPVRGPAAIAEFLQPLMAASTDLILETTYVEHSGKLAYELGRYSLVILQQDGSRKPDQGKYVEVWKRQPSGEWRIVVDSWSSDLPAEMPGTGATYKPIAQSYFDGLARKDLSGVPWAETATLRAPLNPNGGADVPILGRANILAFLNPLLPNLGQVEVIRHYVEGNWGCTRADVGLAGQPPRALRVVDCFHIENGRIVEQENHYDPRPALPPQQ